MRVGDGVESEALALGVDLGTGSARAFVLTGTGRRLGGVRLPYRWRTGLDGSVEGDADRIVELVYAAMDGATATLWPGATVSAVGFSALWHTLLGVDGRGRPVTPVYGWSDTRSSAAAAALRAELDEAGVHRRTGVVLHPSYPPAKLRWLRDAKPELFGRASRWLSLPEYLWLRLTGEHVVDLSVAAASGLLDQRAVEWDGEVLEVCGVGVEQLGKVLVGAGEAAFPGSGVAGAARWPRLRDALWRLPVGDGACANIGSGCHDPTGAALSVGTSAALRVVVPGGWRSPPRGLWCYRMDRDRTVLGGAISNGGVVKEWLENLLRLPARGAELDALLDAREPGGHGLAVLPFLAGERSPHWPLSAAATFSGISLATSALDVFQAGLESVAYRLVLLRRLLREAVPEAVAVVASGGALRRSPAWAQLVADALGEPLLLTSDPEASSRGAALLALEAAGVLDVAGVQAPPSTTIEPDPERHLLHARALERHSRLETRLR